MNHPAQTPVNIIDIRSFHGGHTVGKALEIFDGGAEDGTVILCHHFYRLTIKGQARQDFFREAMDVQSYVCLVPPGGGYEETAGGN